MHLTLEFICWWNSLSTSKVEQLPTHTMSLTLRPLVVSITSMLGRDITHNIRGEYRPGEKLKNYYWWCLEKIHLWILISNEKRRLHSEETRQRKRLSLFTPSKPPENRIECFSKVTRNRRSLQGNLQKIGSISEAVAGWYQCLFPTPLLPCLSSNLNLAQGRERWWEAQRGLFCLGLASPPSLPYIRGHSISCVP